MTRVLLVEDNANLAFLLRATLELAGYVVTVAEDGPAALAATRASRADLVVLDLMLPGLDGHDVLRAMRDAGDDTPVLVLTARGEEADKVRGFRSGADDYVVKPCGTLELLARVEALLRRARVHAVSSGRQSFGGVEVDTGSGVVRRDGREVSLSPKAFALLRALLARRGSVVARHELLREVWQYDERVESRTVDTHVAELRRKLERDPSNPAHIRTVRKAGYRLDG